MKRKIIYIVLIPLLLAFVVLFSDDCGPSKLKQDIATKVVRIQGDKATLERGSQIKSLLSGMEIVRGDLIKTGKDTSVSLQISDIGIILMRPGTSFAISNIPAGSGNFFCKFRTDVGRISVLVNKLSKKSQFVVDTPSCVVGVRGTAFDVETQPGKDVVVAVLEGKVAVEDNQTSKVMFVTSSNQITTPVSGPEKPIITPIEPAKARDLSKLQTLYKPQNSTQKKYVITSSLSDDFSENVLNPGIWVAMWSNANSEKMSLKDGSIHATSVNNISETWKGVGLISLPLDQMINADLQNKKWTYSFDVTLQNKGSSGIVQISEGTPDTVSYLNYGINLTHDEIMLDLRKNGINKQKALIPLPEVMTYPKTFKVTLKYDPSLGKMTGYLDGHALNTSSIKFTPSAILDIASGVWSEGTSDVTFDNMQFSLSDAPIDILDESIRTKIDLGLKNKTQTRFYMNFWKNSDKDFTFTDEGLSIQTTVNETGNYITGFNSRPLSEFLDESMIGKGLSTSMDSRFDKVSNTSHIAMGFEEGKYNEAGYFSATLVCNIKGCRIDTWQGSQQNIGKLIPLKDFEPWKFHKLAIAYNPVTRLFTGSIDGVQVGSKQVDFDMLKIYCKLNVFGPKEGPAPKMTWKNLHIEAGLPAGPVK